MENIEYPENSDDDDSLECNGAEERFDLCSSDEYLEDSLPDLVLSSYCYQNTEDFLASLDLPDLAHELTEIAEEETDIDAEYFSSGDQVTAVGQSVSYVDHSKVPPLRVGGHDVWKSYLNLAPPYEDVERDGDIEEQFKRLVM